MWDGRWPGSRRDRTDAAVSSVSGPAVGDSAVREPFPGLAAGAAEAVPTEQARPWRMSLVVAASALCGGIAVVVWNRRMLARMRENHPAPAVAAKPWEEDEV